MVVAEASNNDFSATHLAYFTVRIVRASLPESVLRNL